MSTRELWDTVVTALSQGWLKVLVVAGIYVAGAIVVRWILIAEPYRNYIRARRTALESQLGGMNATYEQRGNLEQLLDDVDQQLAHRELFVWGRGRERAAGWQLMTAERLAARLLPDEDAVAHALTVLDGLQKLPPSRLGDQQEVREIEIAPAHSASESVEDLLVVGDGLP